MLTRLRVRNFKRLGDVDIELGNLVVFIGPNNSGKTSALQALALWDTGLKRWIEKRKGKTAPEKRPAVTLNRRDLITMPVPDANLLWRNLHVRDVKRANGKPETRNVRVDIILDGVTGTTAWSCGLEFDLANSESIYCRPLRLSEDKAPDRMIIPNEAASVRVAYLPPMSGLAANETRLDAGAINVRVGEGRTAEVLRNLCHRIYEDRNARWEVLKNSVKQLFGAELHTPRYIAERGEIEMTFDERGVTLDLSSSGRGLQQTLLLLAYMYDNPGAVLLLDEPDAHLEILRQRQIYQLLTDVARDNGNQIIAASHSEVVLAEAAERDVVVAFVGKPHRINDRGSQVQKSLREISFEDYYLAEQSGWVLYLEGSTDLAILQALARRMNHRAASAALERPFVQYVANDVSKVRHHFHGLREAVPGLCGVALFDRLERNLPADLGPEGLSWKWREIESYLCTRETLLAYATAYTYKTEIPEERGPLFDAANDLAMRDSISDVESALLTLGKGSPWDGNAKVSDEFLTPVFAAYFQRLGLPNLMSKTNFHQLAEFIPLEQIGSEVREKLDAIARVAETSMRPDDSRL